jgi:hypothetical protein
LNSLLINFLNSYGYKLIKYSYQTEKRSLKIFIVAFRQITLKNKSLFFDSSKNSREDKFRIFKRYRSPKSIKRFALYKKIKPVMPFKNDVPGGMYSKKAKKRIPAYAVNLNPILIYSESVLLVFFRDRLFKKISFVDFVKRYFINKLKFFKQDPNGLF